MGTGHGYCGSYEKIPQSRGVSYIQLEEIPRNALMATACEPPNLLEQVQLFHLDERRGNCDERRNETLHILSLPHLKD